MAVCKPLIFTAEDVEDIDSNVINLVFGYVRSIESALKNTFIPMEIIFLCLSYYYFDDNEYFAIACSCYDVVNTKDEISLGNIVDSDGFPKYGNNPGSAFGNVLIRSLSGGIYVWTFKILALAEHGQPWTDATIHIGISTEEDVETCLDDFEESDGHTYTFGDEGITGYYNKEMYEKYCEGEVKNIANAQLYCNDIITMTLDLNKKTLKYKCPRWSEKNLCDEAGFDDIKCGPDIHYRMAVTCRSLPWDEYRPDRASKIELINFSVVG